MKERLVSPISGALVFVGFLGLLAVGILGITQLASEVWDPSLFWLPLVANGLAVLLLSGFYTLQPNESRVLILFGNYRGTVKKAGWHWGNPFYSNGSPSSELKEERARHISTTKPV
ncbi:MAG: hypothetical protein RL569_1204, partial [Actinomycetota bacterium]